MLPRSRASDSSRDELLVTIGVVGVIIVGDLVVVGFLALVGILS